MAHECSKNLKELYASIGKIITSSLQLEEILDGIMEEIHIFFNPENWSLLRLDPVSNQLFFVIAKGIDFQRVKNIRLNPGEGIAGKVALTGKAIFVPDINTQCEYSPKVDEETGFRTKSIIAVPVKFRDEVFGVIEIINRLDEKNFTEDEFLILKSIADFAAIAFANSLLYQRTMEIARTDILTGAYNRTKLNELMERCQDDSSENRKKSLKKAHIVIAVIDLDKFKEINDNHGHLSGDRALRFLVDKLRERIREQDMLFRIGGDEFLLIMLGQDQEEIRGMNTRMQMILEEVLSLTRQHTPPFSFSFGIRSGECGRLKKLLYESDIEMYDQKKEKETDPEN